MPLRLPSGWYTDPATGTVGPLVLDLAPRSLRSLLRAPLVAPDMVPRLRRELVARLAASSVPLPDLVEPVPVPEKTPKPHLSLLVDTLPLDPAALPVVKLFGGPYEAAVARLSFRYGPVLLPGFGQQATALHDGRVYRVTRNPGEEMRALRTLQDARMRRVRPLCFTDPVRAHNEDFVPAEFAQGRRWIDFVLTTIPALRAAGWTVDIAPNFPFRISEMRGEITAELRQGSGIDWFDLELGAMVDGERIDLIPALLSFIRGKGASFAAEAIAESNGPLMLTLADGRLLSVERARILPIVTGLLELFAGGAVEPDAARITVPLIAAGDLARFENAARIAWQGGEALRTLGRCLTERGGIPPAAVPASFGAVLRPYQARGVDWLQFLRAARLGGVLADDMGLGKTAQTLAHLAIERDAGRLDRPALVVCPTSLVPNWRMETARFAPALRVLVLHGLARKALFQVIPDHDLVITTYPLLLRDHAVLSAQEWHLLVLDEAQTIKNPDAGTSRIVNTLRARQRIGLTGTPLENHLGELWSLFDFIIPASSASAGLSRAVFARP